MVRACWEEVGPMTKRPPVRTRCTALPRPMACPHTQPSGKLTP